MHISTIYKSIYEYFGDTTPLSIDCGKLCGGACCKSDENEDTGMYLFPGEEKLFINDPDFKIIPSEFEYGNTYANILICKGHCDRKKRPLSCRIFPVIPHFNRDDSFKLIFDPRAKSLCPLCDLKDFSRLDDTFLYKTEKVIRLLLNFQKTRSFLAGLNDIVDDFLKFGL